MQRSACILFDIVCYAFVEMSLNLFSLIQKLSKAIWWTEELLGVLHYLNIWLWLNEEVGITPLCAWLQLLLKALDQIKKANEICCVLEYKNDIIKPEEETNLFHLPLSQTPIYFKSQIPYPQPLVLIMVALCMKIPKIQHFFIKENSHYSSQKNRFGVFVP